MNLEKLKLDLSNFSSQSIQSSNIQENCSKSESEFVRYLSRVKEKIVKVKISQDSKNEAELLSAVHNVNPELVFRLDFNETFNYDSFLRFWEFLPASVKAQVQFCEDPIPWSATNWQKLHDYGVPLAADRVIENFVEENKNSPTKYVFSPNIFKLLGTCVQFLVLKPARYDFYQMLTLNQQVTSQFQSFKIKLVVTSYLDHPVGIAHSYVAALKLKDVFAAQVSTCGLLSMTAYEECEFKLGYGIQSTPLKVPDEFGIGFTHLLEKQAWIYCSQF
jgi:O-succinylbenzoate synthase